MLLIAQPKSGSIKLVKMIHRYNNNIKTLTGIPKKKNDDLSEEYIELQKYHKDMVIRSPKFLKDIITSRLILYQEHILPTDRHLKLLRKIKTNFIIILRDTEDCLNEYLKQFRQNKRKNYDKKQLLEDIRKFHDRYLWWASNKPNVLVFYYKDLKKNFNFVLKKVIKHYKLVYNRDRDRKRK